MTKPRFRILIVDDTLLNLELLKQQLKGCECEVYFAQSGAEALDLVQQTEFVVIILDIQMPKMDGYETARKLKKLSNWCHTPIIFVTSIFQDEKSVNLGYEVGAVDYLVRPVAASMLRAKVNVFIDLHLQRLSLEEEIAKRTRLAKALSKAEERYRSFFEKAVEGIFQASIDGTLLDVNPAMVRIMGYDLPGELMGQPGLASKIMVNPEEREHYLKVLRDEGYVSNWEYQVRRKDGKIIWLSESSHLVAVDGKDIIEGLVEDITQRKASELDLQRLATFDALTEIPNRVLFFDRLTHALASAKRYDDRVAVLFLDLNNFKLVNDSHGHSLGDEVLRMVADRFRKNVRVSDTLARLGGDEFGVVLPAVDSDEAAIKVADGLIGAMAKPFKSRGVSVTVGVTVGISFYPEHAATASELVRMADLAMYSVKRGAGNGFAIYDSATQI